MKPFLITLIQKRMIAMLDNPQGRDCNEMVGYQVRQKINTKEGRDSKVFHFSLVNYNPTSLPDFVKNLTK